MKKIRIEHKGMVKDIGQWSIITGLSRRTIWTRYYNGKSSEEILFRGKLVQPKQRYFPFKYNPHVVLDIEL